MQTLEARTAHLMRHLFFAVMPLRVARKSISASGKPSVDKLLLKSGELSRKANLAERYSIFRAAGRFVPKPLRKLGIWLPGENEAFVTMDISFSIGLPLWFRIGAGGAPKHKQAQSGVPKKERTFRPGGGKNLHLMPSIRVWGYPAEGVNTCVGKIHRVFSDDEWD